jgi:DNA processing protein
MHHTENTAISKEKISYNALSHTFEGTYESIKKALGVHGSAARAWSAEKGSPTTAEALWEALEKHDVRLHLSADPEFPQLLREMPWPPFALYTKGAPLTTTLAGIAIVGTRKATPEGKALAREFGKGLARRGVTVISGLALGIDGEAHKGALEARGKTIAVLPCGLDRVYPREHDRLAHEILSTGGMLISEYPLGAPAYPSRFIERNRIVSALSTGVIVIEAPEKSGALSTARFALEQNREVFVVPGSVKNRNYAGSHALIRDGASLIRGIKDVCEALGMSSEEEVSRLPLVFDGLDETKKAILNCLHMHGELTPDQIARLISLDIQDVQREVALLLIDERLQEKPNGTYVLKI